MNHKRQRNQLAEELKKVIVLSLTIILAAMLCGGKQQNRTLPTVISASVPLYPQDAHLAHIEGKILLRVSTDGTKVSAVQVLGGQPLLGKVAEENVKTWQFKQHTPTSFDVTYGFEISPEAECDLSNSEVLLRLPTSVHISAKTVKTCDPSNIGK